MIKMTPRMDPGKPQIITFPIPNRPRATRQAGSKVRTGCITCKKRHVKCDETKPHCMRCLKSKGNCEGYERRTPEPPTSKSLRPKPSPTPEPQPGPSSTSTSQSPFLQPPAFNTQPYLIDKEQVYFEQWTKFSDSLTGGLVAPDFWKKAIPQSSYNEEAVKCAALAVGAISLAIAKNTGPNILTREELYKTDEYTDGLTYHAKALRLVGQSSPRNVIRIAVVSCILFYVYAAMAEEEDTAMRHLIHGTMILEQFIGNQFGTSVDMLLQSPADFQVEDEIFQVFNRVAYNFLVHKYLLQPWTSLPQHIFIRQPATKVPREIPPVFESLTQARRWWDLLLARVSDSARARLKLSSQTPSDWLHTNQDGETDGDNIGAMEAWHRAFGPIYHRACDTQQERFDDFLRAIHLEVQFLTYRAALVLLGSCEYHEVVSLTPDFGEILRLLEIVLHFQVTSFTPHDAVVTMDMGHVLSTHLISMNCRDKLIREKAISLLEKYPRRDGLWDSRSVVAMARMNSSIEDENRMKGSQEEQWSRLKHREVVIDCTKRRGTLRASRYDATTSSWTMRTELFTW